MENQEVAPVAQASVDGEAPAPTSQPTAPEQSQATEKKVGALVLDSGGLIKNEIAISTLLSQTDELYTIPSVISELKDATTRARIQPLMPFLKLRTPRPESSKFISDFARKTGDLSVLSRVDLQLLALTYELEKEKNKGDWRLRNEPSQKTLNGKPPGQQDQSGEAQESKLVAVDSKQEAPVAEYTEAASIPEVTDVSADSAVLEASETSTEAVAPTTPEIVEEVAAPETSQETSVLAETVPEINTATEEADKTSEQVADLSLDPVPAPIESAESAEPASIEAPPQTEDLPQPEDAPEDAPEVPETAPKGGDLDDDDDGEWITPSNLDKHRKKDGGLGAAPEPITKKLQVAILTTDNAMRNVALRINLNLLDPSFARVTYIKTWVLRCHTCMKICKEQKQFCPSCGHPTLTRVSVSTDAHGNFSVHLKKNFQWNNRGNVFSIPKPTHGSASGKASNVKGGGKGGWGQELVLAEDQKEYTKQMDEQRRTRYRDIMDEDYLPSILSGDRKGAQSKIKVGAGRNVNSKKRR